MLKRRLPALEDDAPPAVDSAMATASAGIGATAALAVSSASAATAATAATDRTERRRKQCRISQRRYRDKKGSAEYNLRLDINNLRENVERLKQARGLLEHKQQHDRRALRASVLKAVEQYYAMFQFGLHDPHAGAHVRQCYDIQVNFLRAFMDPAVECGGSVGVDAVLEQWRRYSRYHSALRVELVESEVFGSDSESPIVKATGRLTVTLNRATLEHVFPHVLHDEDLAHFLIGQQVAYTTCTEYVFDEKVQVIRQDFTVDFLSGLGAVLRDPFVTADVLRAACISHSSHLGPPAADDTAGSAGATAAAKPAHRVEEDEAEEEEEDDDNDGDNDDDNDDDDNDNGTDSTAPDLSARDSTASSSASSARLALQFIMS